MESDMLKFDPEFMEKVVPLIIVKYESNIAELRQSKVFLLSFLQNRAHLDLNISAFFLNNYPKNLFIFFIRIISNSVKLSTKCTSA